MPKTALLLLLLLVGCTTAREYAAVRIAVQEFPCDLGTLESEMIAVDTYRVTGCGKTATYITHGENCSTLAECQVTSLGVRPMHSRGEGKKKEVEQFIRENQLATVKRLWWLNTRCTERKSRFKWLNDGNQVGAAGCGLYNIYRISGSCSTRANCIGELISVKPSDKKQALPIIDLRPNMAWRVKIQADRELYCKDPAATVEYAGVDSRAFENTLQETVAQYYLYKGCGFEAYYLVSEYCFKKEPCKITFEPNNPKNLNAIGLIRKRAVEKRARSLFAQRVVECEVESIQVDVEDWYIYRASGCGYTQSFEVDIDCDSIADCKVEQLGDLRFANSDKVEKHRREVIQATAAYDLGCQVADSSITLLGGDLYRVTECDVDIKYKVTGDCQEKSKCTAHIADTNWRHIAMSQESIISAVKQRASFDLNCRKELSVIPLLQSSFLVRGCQRKVVYELQGECSNRNNCRIVQSRERRHNSGPPLSIMQATVERQAAFDFQCDGSELTITFLGTNLFGAQGCEKRGNYRAVGRCDTLARCSAGPFYPPQR